VRQIERGELGKEASWAGAGILPPAIESPDAHPYDQLRGLSYALHREWAERLRAETGIDNGYRLCGGLYVARSAGEAASLIGMVEFLRGEGIRVEIATSQTIVEIEPGLADAMRRAPIKSSFFLPDEAQIRNPRHLQALVAACRKAGVTLLESAAVHSFDLVGGRIASVRTSQGNFSANRFCITSGAWTQGLLSQLGIENGILPIRGQMILFASSQPLIRCVLNEGPRYLVPRDDGHLLAGSTEEEAGFDKSNTAEVIRELADFAYSWLPQLQNAKIERTWAGLRPASFDGFPYIGAVPGLENGFVAAGHFRSGLYLSPGTATLLAQQICGETPSISLSPFRVGR
jgi:glycine oxidase